MQLVSCIFVMSLLTSFAHSFYNKIYPDHQDNSIFKFDHDSGDDELELRTTRGDPFLRFGRGDPFLRFGRNDPFLRFGRGDPFLRFGRGDPFLRFGRSDALQRTARGDPFLRFGRGDPFLRFGRGDPFLRFGRGDPFLRFGRGDPFLRFGRDSAVSRTNRGDPFLRFGRFKPSDDGDEAPLDAEDEDITRRSNSDKTSRRKREVHTDQIDQSAGKIYSDSSSVDTKDKTSAKRDVMPETQNKRYFRNNLSDYGQDEDSKTNMMEDEYNRMTREPSRMHYPRYGKRNENGRVFMRFGRPAGSDFISAENPSQK